MSVDKNNQTYKRTSFLTGVNSDYIQEYYALYLQNPNLLTKDWIEFFDGLKEDSTNILQNIKGPSWNPKKIKQIDNFHNIKKQIKEQDTELTSANQASKDSVRAIMLIRAFRIRGHLIANLDPLKLQIKEEHPELKPETYGFKKQDYSRKIFLDGVLGLQYGTLNEILKILKQTYCSTIGYEFMHMNDPEEKAWIRNRIEGPEKIIAFTDNGKKAILNKIIEAEGFEKYLQIKFVGTKRFGLDGGEALIPALEQIIKRGGNLGVKEIKIGMPHRGRLNVLANVMGKSYQAIFSEFFGKGISAKEDFAEKFTENCLIRFSVNFSAKVFLLNDILHLPQNLL